MPLRRDAEGRLILEHDWESVTERLIREDKERGEFDDLPYRGERLPIEENAYAGDEALLFHVLRNAGVAPPWIEADVQARKLLERLARLISRAPATRTAMARGLRVELRQTVAEANAAIDRPNAEAPGPAQHRRRLDPAAEQDRLERVFQSPG